MNKKRKLDNKEAKDFLKSLEFPSAADFFKAQPFLDVSRQDNLSAASVRKLIKASIVVMTLEQDNHTTFDENDKKLLKSDSISYDDKMNLLDLQKKAEKLDDRQDAILSNSLLKVFDFITKHQSVDEIDSAVVDFNNIVNKYITDGWKKKYSALPPAESIDKYIPRKSGKASDFLYQHYGPYIESGVCFRPDILRIDPQLHTALKNEFANRAAEYRAILPIKSDEVDARITRELGKPVRPEKRKAAAAAVRHIKYAKS